MVTYVKLTFCCAHSGLHSGSFHWEALSHSPACQRANSSAVIGAWQPLGFHLKKKSKTTGGIFLFKRQRGNMEREGKIKQKSIYNPVVHPNLCTGCSMPPFQSVWASRTAQAVYEPMKRTAAWPLPPQVTGFSLKWQQ